MKITKDHAIRIAVRDIKDPILRSKEVIRLLEDPFRLKGKLRGKRVIRGHRRKLIGVQVDAIGHAKVKREADLMGLTLSDYVRLRLGV